MMHECWCALALCILSQISITPEKAFMCLDQGIVPLRTRGQTTITEADVLDMVVLRKNGVHYREIGDMFGMDASTVHKRVKRYLERRGL